MDSERYTVSLFGVNTNYYTVEFVSNLWDIAATKIYENSGIFVTATVDVRHLVCGGNRECEFGNLVNIISVVRNPFEVDNKDVFYNSFISVLQEVREKLGNPNMTLTVDKTNYYYFTQI